MKLSPAEIRRTQSQIEAEPIADNNPAMQKLNTLFGEHTFFIGERGLHIVEPVREPASRESLGQVMKVASWTSDERDSLAPHEPRATELVVPLGEEEDL